VLISDGNDTSSNTPRVDVRQLIHESEVLVYAVGIDGNGDDSSGSSSPGARPSPVAPPRSRIPLPPPPGRRPPGLSLQMGAAAARRSRLNGDHVDASALRDLTDDSGGRTEIIRDARDLHPATAGIADELSKQYDLSYLSTGRRDGRWHVIRVEVKNPAYRVRARRGYFAN
jgi:VWFA-related protein